MILYLVMRTTESAIRSNAFGTRRTIMIASLLEQGVICVIVESSPHIGVRWNEEVVGGHDCQGACSRGYGWFVTASDIKRIDDNDEFEVDATELDKLFETFTKEAIS